MKLKLDENFGRRCIDILSEAGHDVATVARQQMSGAADEDVIQICSSESRCLVSLDLDFANPLRFRTNARMISMFTKTARLLRNTLDSIATPCSVHKTAGIES